MNETFNIEPIIRDIEGHHDREIARISERSQGQFSSGIEELILEQFISELKQKGESFVTAGLTIEDISSGLDATVQRALRIQSDEFARRGVGDSTAYLNAQSNWSNRLAEARDAIVEQCKISLAQTIDEIVFAQGHAMSARTEQEASGQGAGLHPWGVISALLFDLNSDEVVDIVSRSGLKVDWMVTEKESYSHSTRKRAYRPRVDAAFSRLNDSDKLRVVWVISTELANRHPHKSDDLRNRLSNIGWSLDGETIRPGSKPVEELFFPRGSEHDAYIHIREIVRTAKQKITVIDPYLDTTILNILGTAEEQIDIELLTHAVPIDFSREVEMFQKQYSPNRLEVKRTREFHDRFIVIDGAKCFHIGASIKDAGGRAFMISQVRDEENVRAILDQLAQSWGTANPI